MPTQQQTGLRPLETPDDLAETRLEAIGFVFHGTTMLGAAAKWKRKPSIKADEPLPFRPLREAR